MQILNKTLFPCDYLLITREHETPPTKTTRQMIIGLNLGGPPRPQDFLARTLVKIPHNTVIIHNYL